MDDNRGSIFRKWDLHIHSLYSHSILNNLYRVSNSNEKKKDYLSLLKENEIEVIGLTNYFNFKPEDFALKSYLENHGITVFLNLELRLENGNAENDTCDIHIIFDNTLTSTEINEFLSNMKAKVVNKKLINLSNDDDFKKAVINFDDLKNTLDDTSLSLRNRYLIGILARGKGSSRSSSVFEDIATRCDFFIHSSDKMETILKDQDFINSQFKPLLQSSDAHSFDKIGQKFSWIKADKSFDGLRQILFEPKARINLEKDYPDRKLDYQVIDYIELDEGRRVFLNSSLNTIIGGRSTGKSTLINSIAKELNNKNIRLYDNSQKSEVIHFFENDLKIQWRDGEEHYDIEFLPQNYMIEIAENLEERNRLIRDTVKSDKDNYERITTYEEDVRTNQDAILDLFKQWTTLKDELSTLSQPEGDRHGVEVQLEKLRKQVAEQEKKGNFLENEVTEYTHINDEFKDSLKTNKEIIRNIDQLQKIKELNINLSLDLSHLFDSQIENELNAYIDILSEEVNIKWKEKIENIISNQSKESSKYVSRINEIKNNSIFIKGQENVKNNEILKNITEIQQQEIEKLAQFETYELEKLKLESRINVIQNDILERVKTFKELRTKLKGEFEVKAEPVEIKLDFIKTQFEDRITYLHGKSNINNTFIDTFDEDMDSQINSIFNDLNLVYNKGKNQIDLIRDILSQQWYKIHYILQYDGDNFEQMSQGKKAFVILTLILEFSNDKKPVIIDQPEDSLDNRSIYKDLTSYLKDKKEERQIILVTHNPNIVVGADAENVIVANQHSNDSPNESNVKFDYINGSLENSFIDNDNQYILNKKGIREHVIEILEGGKEAFTKREQKYK